MKNLIKFMLLGSLCLVSVTTQARDTAYKLPINDVLSMPEAREKLNPAIKFYFGKAAPGRIVTSAVTNKKTNSFGKSDEKACKWAMLSALVQLQEKAQKSGVSKVSKIISYYKKVPFNSSSLYECHAGAVVAGVALKADFVR